MTAVEGVQIRALTELAQFDDCVALQDAVWGYDDSARMSQKVFCWRRILVGRCWGRLRVKSWWGMRCRCRG